MDDNQHPMNDDHLSNRSEEKDQDEEEEEDDNRLRTRSQKASKSEYSSKSFEIKGKRRDSAPSTILMKTG